MDECTDSLSFEKVLLDNTDILTCIDSTIVPRIESETYARLVNREGYFYIGEALHKVTDEKVIVSLSGSKSSVDNAQNNQLKHASSDTSANIYIFNYNSNTTEDNSMLKYGTKKANKKKDRDTSSRRCRLEMWANNITSMSIIRNHYGQILSYRVTDKKEFVVIVRNYKYSWGKYRSYKTKCKLYDISFKTNQDNRTYTYSHKESSSDVNSMSVTWNLYSQYSDYKPGTTGIDKNPVTPVIYTAKGKASNRGIGYSKYAEIK